jgi:mono/diheme cytochrome c family protein
MTKRFKETLLKLAQYGVIALAALAIFAIARGLVGGPPVAHALPEYAQRTGESCAACHVSAGGGGSLTMRGLLWAAQGRPDVIPDLPGLLLAPGVADGTQLYDVGCAGCHGYRGEGLFAIGLAGTNMSSAAARSFIVRGIPELGMPAFDGQFTTEQVDILADFTARLGAGEIPPSEYPLATPAYACAPVSAAACGEE